MASALGPPSPAMTASASTALVRPSPLPRPRGPLSAAVLEALVGAPGSFGAPGRATDIDAVTSDDLQLALYLCYELHYRPMDGVDPDWEWDPDLLRFRSELERSFLSDLRREIGPRRTVVGGAATSALVSLIDKAAGPSLSTFMVESGTLEQLREFCIHRSAYQLKEADPHTFAIPRLSGDAKTAMVEIQYDEYGSGVAGAMHAELFATTLGALGLDPTYGAYLDQLPGITLATVNLISLFALHRRWRAAALGHLAVFEMTSIEPMARYSRALAGHGIGVDGRHFYDVHVVADAGHGVIALDRMVAGLAATEPDAVDDLLFGATALLTLEGLFTEHLLDAWSAGSTSLRSVKRRHLAA
jgi:Iron-containing redox enzyme